MPYTAPGGAPVQRPKKPLWRRWWVILTAAVVVLGVIGAVAAPKDDDTSDGPARTTTAPVETTSAPADGAAATTTATDTEATDAPAATAAAVEEPSEVTPLPPDANPALVVVGVDSLPAGEPGELSVIAQATTLERSGSLLVVVRNMTDKPVVDIEVTGTARDGSGALVGSGSSQGFTPYHVGPGEIAFGYVYFSFDGVPAGTTFELSVSGTDPDARFLLGKVDLVVAEHNRSGSSIVVALRNDSDEEVSGPISLSLMCFDEAGVPTQTGWGYADQDSAAPGATVTGTIDFYGDAPCERYILGGAGYNF